MKPRVPWPAAAALVACLTVVVTLQAAEAPWRGGAMPSAPAGVPSAPVVSALSLSYQAVAADIYWMRVLQYFGRTRLSSDPAKRYDLLYPLLDLTTSLDPRFAAAYLFGAVFLAEPPPGGPGRPDLAIMLLDKGLATEPGKWEYAQAIGFVHYWWLHDYPEAAAWFTRAAAIPGAPDWLVPLAATTLAQGGQRESARLLWRQMASAGNEWFRRESVRRLQQLDAMDQIDALQRLVDDALWRQGRAPVSWADVDARYRDGGPADPAGFAYRLEAGIIQLDPASPLAPLPWAPLVLR